MSERKPSRRSALWPSLQILHYALNCAALGTSEKMALIALGSHLPGWTESSSDRDLWSCWPSVSRLATVMGCTKNTAKTALRGLEAHGVLIVEARTRDDGSAASSRYEIQLDGGWVDQNPTRVGQNLTEGGGSNFDQGGSTIDPEVFKDLVPKYQDPSSTERSVPTSCTGAIAPTRFVPPPNPPVISTSILPDERRRTRVRGGVAPTSQAARAWILGDAAVDGPPDGPGSPQGDDRPAGRSLTADWLAGAWNRHRGKLAACSALTPERLAKANARLKELGDTVKWITVIQTIAKSPGCNGRNKSGWKASFDYLLKPGVWARALEGTLDWSKPLTANEQRQEIDRVNGQQVADDLAAAIAEDNREDR